MLIHQRRNLRIERLESFSSHAKSIRTPRFGKSSLAHIRLLILIFCVSHINSTHSAGILFIQADLTLFFFFGSSLLTLNCSINYQPALKTTLLTVINSHDTHHNHLRVHTFTQYTAHTHHWYVHPKRQERA